MQIRDLKVELVPVSVLKPYERNARTHSKKQIRQIAESIRVFGWTNPILIDGTGGVIAGHGRLEGAKLLRIDPVPIIRIADMTEAQKRAYVLADNRLAENAGWDSELLALELQALLEMDLDFEIGVTGFEMAEIDSSISELDDDTDDEADRLPEVDSDLPPVTQPGDLWQLGPHRILCADATKAESFEKLMAGERAELVFTDPPYNQRVAQVSGRGSKKHSEFAMASGEMTSHDYVRFLEITLGSMAEHSRDGAIHFVCEDWRHINELLTAGHSVYDAMMNICVWVKTNGGMGSFYRSQHELVAVFKKGTAAHVNNIELGRFGRNRTNVWTYAGMNSFGVERDEALAMHPTVKPVRLVQDAILDCSSRNGIVLDGFLGSGTTLIAAHRVGRRGFGLEIESRYVDVALRRFRAFSGIEPVHAESGFTLKELESGRPRGSIAAGSSTDRQ